MRIDARTIAYTVVMVVLFAAVAWLLTKMARTDMGDRRLIIIGAAMVGGAIAAGLGALRIRSDRRRR